MANRVGQLHLVTDADIDHAEIMPMIRLAVRAGVDVVQVRYLRLGARELSQVVQAIWRETATSSAAVIVNDRVDVAIALGADGVHLGQRSLPVDVARRLTGADMVIGASVHSVAEARKAADGGADYLTFGHVYPSKSHPDEAARGTTVLAEVVDAVGSVPVIAIGGITPERVPKVLDAGAAGVAVMRSIFQSDDVAKATSAFSLALKRHILCPNKET